MNYFSNHFRLKSSNQYLHNKLCSITKKGVSIYSSFINWLVIYIRELFIL